MDQAFRDVATDVSAGREMAVQQRIAGAERARRARVATADRGRLQDAYLRAVGYEGDGLLDLFEADPSAAELLHDEFSDFEAGAADAVLPERMDHAARVSLGRVRPAFDR